MIEIYTKDYCPYCHKAKSLLDSLKVQYREIDVTHDQEKFQEAIEKSGFRTVPQIFLDDKCLGGCDDIYRLHEEGSLLSTLQNSKKT